MTLDNNSHSQVSPIPFLIVQNEFRSQLSYPNYSWEEARGEIEFLHRCQDGEVIPVGVKRRLANPRQKPAYLCRALCAIENREVDRSGGGRQ